MTLASTLTADRRRALADLRAATERVWERPLHCYFTDHGVTHSERILALLEGLTTGIQKTDKRLVPAEIFVLLAAAYLHDIGMQDERFAGGDLKEIRAHHHEQTAEMIYRVFEDPQHAFSLPLGDDPTLVEAIALVAEGHRKVDLSSSEYESLPLGDELLRLRLLAALLRFADELDIDYRRVDLEQLKLLDLPVESQLHWWKCHYVAGVRIVDEYIRVAYRFPRARPDYEQLLIPLVENEIRAKHAASEPIFREHGVKVAIGKPQVRLMRLLKPMREEVEALAGIKEGATSPESGEDVRLELLIAGTPTQFGYLIRELNEELEHQYRQRTKGSLNDIFDVISPFSVSTSKYIPQYPRFKPQPLPSDAPVVYVSFPNYREEETEPVYGMIRAVSMPGKTRLIVEAAGQDWPKVERYWNRLREELGKRGLVDKTISTKPPDSELQAQHIGTQINVAGDYAGRDIVHIEGDGNVIGDHSSSHVEKVKAMETSASDRSDTAQLRVELRRLDAVELESLCLDHFSAVYDKFGRGMRRDEMINLLLDHCRRHPEDANRLDDLLK